MKRASSDRGGGKAKSASFRTLGQVLIKSRTYPSEQARSKSGAGTEKILEPEDFLKEMLAQEKEEISGQYTECPSRRRIITRN